MEHEYFGCPSWPTTHEICLEIKVLLVNLQAANEKLHEELSKGLFEYVPEQHGNRFQYVSFSHETLD